MTDDLAVRAGLEVVVLSDGRPGHYHLAEGVAAAIARIAETTVRRVEVRRRKAAPTRLLSALLAARLSPSAVLRIGYGLDLGRVPACDVVISAGGDTIAANVALARARRIANVFCGTLRHARPRDFALIVSSYARHKGLENHLVALKPNGIDPDRLPARRGGERLGPGRPPGRVALLVGGNSGLFRYRSAEWDRLLRFLPELSTATGARWLVSTSRRTDAATADALAALAAREPGIEELIDYRTAGPGTLPRVLARADMALCTEDSSTMISEAVCARLPVIGIAPREHAFKPDEAEYRQLMLDQGWCRFLALADLSVERLLALLGEVTPLAANHLDLLAGELKARLPRVFAGRPGPAAGHASAALTS